MFLYGIIITISGFLLAGSIMYQEYLGVAGWSMCLLTYMVIIFKKFFEDYG